MKRLDKQLDKLFDNELKYLLSVLTLLPFTDRRRTKVFEKIQQIKRIQRLDKPTEINVTSNNESPFVNLLKQTQNGKITKKEPKQSKFTRKV